MAKKTEFEKELKALLLKHNARIDYDFADYADTHGLADSGMALYVDNKRVKALPYESNITAGKL